MEELWEKSEKYNPRGWRVARGRSLVTRFYTDTVTLKATLFLLSPLFSTLRGGLKSFVKLDESVFSLREQSIITFFFFFHDFFPPGKHTRTKGYHFIWLLFLFSALVDFQLGRLRLLSIWQSEQPEQSVPDEWLQVSHGCVNKAKERETRQLGWSSSSHQSHRESGGNQREDVRVLLFCVHYHSDGESVNDFLNVFSECVCVCMSRRNRYRRQPGRRRRAIRSFYPYYYCGVKKSKSLYKTTTTNNNKSGWKHGQILLKSIENYRIRHILLNYNQHISSCFCHVSSWRLILNPIR